MRRKRIQVSSGTYWWALATLPRRITSQMDQTAASTLCCVASIWPPVVLFSDLKGRFCQPRPTAWELDELDELEAPETIGPERAVRQHRFPNPQAVGLG